MQSVYEEKVKPFLDDIKHKAFMGWSLKDIAEDLGVANTTFIRYKKEHSELAEAIAEGAKKPDNDVETALYRTCTGYFVEEEMTTTTTIDGVEKKTTSTKKRWVAPSPAAQQFWLTNRKPNDWKYRKEEAAGGSDQAECGVVLMPEVEQE